MGEWIGAKLNACEGEVRFLLPEGGVSLIDAPGQPFHDPDADAALFEALEATVRQTDRRRLIRLPHNVNDPEFAAALVQNFREIAPLGNNSRRMYRGFPQANTGAPGARGPWNASSPPSSPPTSSATAG